MKEQKIQTFRMKLSFMCNTFGHNNKGMIYKMAENPDKKIKEWVGYFCSRCGVITQKHPNYNLTKLDGSYDDYK